ncbi:ribokinase [Sutterella sp.]|uniref:ribokinase n=1 Tax=Sutterella sp. TaxID=1981025 RepID=UPI0026DFA2D7|nr:ribokinase [Sutterella sp.]MDO5532306.1 ribokinase [Sutterella sp.]
MARVLNIGSLNIDNVYQVPHFVRGGETLAAYRRARHVGGKGLNQSVALARAGLEVLHAGRIGTDGEFLKEFLRKEGVDVNRVEVDDAEASGHCFIQISPEGENSILYYPGTNVRLTKDFIREAIRTLNRGEALLIQNETNGVKDTIRYGLERNLRIIFNPSPYDSSVPLQPLDDLAAVIMNETELEGILDLSKRDRTDDQYLELIAELGSRYPNTALLVTLGSRGCAVRYPGCIPVVIPAFKVHAVDTTGAGDTFTGFAVRALIEAWEAEDEEVPLDRIYEKLLTGIRFAQMAAAISVTRAGAAQSIPKWVEVDAALARL